MHIGSFRGRLAMRIARSARARLGLDELQRSVDHARGELGRLFIRDAVAAPGLHEAEFSCYSQFGEDGILQWLIGRIELPATFAELGSSEYKEANTRFLAQVLGWRGLIVDGSTSNIELARRQWWFERRDVTAVAAFVTAENVARVLAQAPVPLGLLTIDLDGMDYWVWRATPLTPPIVVIEYNSRFGPEQAVTVPYDPAFERAKAHPSHVYFGASLEALRRLGNAKGYSLVGCGSAGVNAFFVRSDMWAPGLASEEAFRAHTHHEHRNDAFDITFIPVGDEANTLVGLPVVGVQTNGEPDDKISGFELSAS